MPRRARGTARHIFDGVARQKHAERVVGRSRQTPPDAVDLNLEPGHALVHAVLPLQSDPVFNFVRGGMRSLLTLLLPADAAQCYADLLSSRRYEAFLNLANAHLTESTAPSSTGGSIRLRKSELLVDLVGDCVDAIESMAKSSARQMNLVLYYSGVQQSASPRPPSRPPWPTPTTATPSTTGR